MKKFITSFLYLLLSFPLFTLAQEPEMADTFRSEGKIYVVITVMAVILIGIFIYLFSLGNKISRLEKKLGERK